MASVLNLIAGVLAAISAQASQPMLKEVPKEGEIPYRKVVLVDDGTCPTGEVKEITGGSSEKAIPRKIRCVKRPAKSD